ncbi:hypothetical protein LTS18_007800, partial [Coniosporium uncinatum]
TPDHLFEAAVRGKRDGIEGVSECIIMGQSMRVGTGGFEVVRALGLERGEGEGEGEGGNRDGAKKGDLGRERVAFDDKFERWKRGSRKGTGSRLVAAAA